MRQLSLIRLVVALGVGLAVLPAVRAANTPEQSFTTARQLFETAHDQQAADVLEAMLAAFPNDRLVPEAAFLLGRCNQRLQRLDKALTAYQLVTTKAVGPDFGKLRSEAHYQMAECYLAQKDYAKASTAYRNCLKLSGDADLTARAQYWLAESLYQLGRDDEALAEYRRVTTLAPTHELAPWAFYSMGMIDLRQSRFPGAITSLERLTTQYKTSEVFSEATLALGYAYAGQARGATEAAVKKTSYDKAIGLFNSIVDETVKATSTAKQHAVLALAQAYFDQQNYGKAEAAYAKALEGMAPASPATLEVRLLRAHALYNAERYSDAAGEYRTVADGVKKDSALLPQALYWMGNSWFALAEKGKNADAYTKASAALQQYLTVGAGQDATRDARAALLLAFCYEDLSQNGDAAVRAKALDAFKDVLKRWPSSREAKQAQDGMTRLTATMSITELKNVSGTLPPGAAAWNAALRMAREAFLAAKYEDALAAIRTVMNDKPTGEVLAQATYLTGASLQKLGRTDEAIAAYKQALAAVPTTTPPGELTCYAQRGLTLAYLEAKRFKDAQEAGEALNALPTQATTPADIAREKAERLMYLGEAYLGSQQLDRALATYQQVVNNYPTSSLVPNALMAMGWIFETRRDRPQAVAAYRDLIAKFPDQGKLVSEAFFRLGFNLAEQKDYAGAVEAYKGVPAGHTLADQATYAIAWALRDQGKDDAANAQFAVVAEKYPKSPLAADALYRVGEYWLAAKNYDEGLRAFSRAQDLVGQGTLGALISYKLGVCAFFAKQYVVASTAFGRVVANYPNSEQAQESLFWRGQALERQEGQATIARDVYVLYVTRFPNGAKVLDAALGAGRGALTAKQYAMARTDLQKALTLCDQFAQGANKDLADRAVNVRPEAQYDLAQSYFDEKNYPEALKQFAAVSAYKLDPWYSRSMLQMARCSAITGDRKAAVSTLKLLIKIAPTSDAALDAPNVAKEYNLDLTAE